jgi:hypothetical protein
MQIKYILKVWLQLDKIANKIRQRDDMDLTQLGTVKVATSNI